MYFEPFNKIVYDFNSGVGGTNQLTLIKDITKNIRFKKNFIESLTIFEPYRIQDGDTPEIIAERVYGSPEYNWIIMLFSQRYDHVEDFPLSGDKLDNMIVRKYGTRANDIHHYENLNGGNINGSQILTIANPFLDEINNYFYSKLSVGNVISRNIRVDGILTEYNGWIESIDSVNEKIYVNISNGSFKIDDIVNIYDNYDDVNGDYQHVLVGSASILDVSYPEGIYTVTNAMYEYNINEEKRNINIIPKQYLDQIMNEFSELMGS